MQYPGLMSVFLTITPSYYDLFYVHGILKIHIFLYFLHRPLLSFGNNFNLLKFDSNSKIFHDS